MHKGILKTALLLSAFSVILGAFAAHALKKNVDAGSVSIFETGVRYQFYHAFAILISGILYKEFNQKIILKAYYSFLIGVLLFCGSLYVLTIMSDYSWIGIITPFGGLSFIIGWCLLFYAVYKQS